MTAHWIVATVLVGVMLASGCSGKAKGQAEGSTITVSSAAQAKYSDPLAASALRERALDALATLAGDPNAQLRANALEAMETTPGRLAEFIPRALRDENPGVRSVAAMLIGRAELHNLAPAARPLLNDCLLYTSDAADE